MVNAFRFKGEKKVKKRKRAVADPSGDSAGEEGSSKKVLVETRKIADGEEEEGWVDSDDVDDINGPIILCFSASTPITLACDAAGKVFASPLVDVIGDDLSAAEPTDVKQVWVATKIHGCEKWSLKSHHGKYLGCDQHGILSATREAISPEEEFVPVRNELGGGRWALQTVRERFVGVDESGGVIEVRGDAESVGFGETWRLRLQKRNKKKTKGVGSDGKTKDKITRKELEELAGVKLNYNQIKTLKKSRREGRFHEALLDIRVKHGKHDKFAY